MATKKIIYVADPMCSWCWGFSPVISNILTLAGERVDFNIVMGGLRSETQVMTKERIAMLREYWPGVQKQTGQPFNMGLLERNDFIYDTEPPCRAVITVRTMAGDRTALEMCDRLQSAFYADNADITQGSCCTDIAAEMGLDAQVFRDLFDSEKLKAATRDDFDRARDLGVVGFPTIIIADGRRSACLTRGFQPFETLREPLKAWLEDHTDASFV